MECRYVEIEIMKEEKNNYVENERMFREAMNNSVQSLKNVNDEENTSNIQSIDKQYSFGFVEET